MKQISISVSGSGKVSDELATKLKDVTDELKAAAPNTVYVTLGITDVVESDAPTA